MAASEEVAAMQTRGKTVDYRSIEKIQDLLAKDQKAAASAGAAKQDRYYKCSIVSKRPRVVDGEPKMKVHYLGWGRQYDEWRPVSELTGRSVEDEGEKQQVGAENKLVTEELKQMKIQIQEMLNGARRRDTLVDIRVPVSYETWSQLSSVCRVKRTFPKRPTIHSIRRGQDLEQLLGAGWNKRIFNEHGDFSEVVIQTLELSLLKRKPLKCFEKMPNGNFAPNFLDRGLFAKIRFVRKDGNFL